MELILLRAAHVAAKPVPPVFVIVFAIAGILFILRTVYVLIKKATGPKFLDEHIVAVKKLKKQPGQTSNEYILFKIAKYFALIEENLPLVNAKGNKKLFNLFYETQQTLIEMGDPMRFTLTESEKIERTRLADVVGYNLSKKIVRQKNHEIVGIPAKLLGELPETAH